MIPSTGERCFKCENGRFGECVKNRCIHNSRLRSLLGFFEADHYLKKKTYRMVDTIICPSEFLKKKIETYPAFKDGNKSPDIVAMHNFIETVIDERTGSENKGDYVLYFGRYSEEKGVKTLLKVCNEMPAVNFKFAGSGPLKELVENKDNITEMGFLHGEDLFNTIRRAKIVAFPSEWYENCPFSVMESIAYGTPVLASDLGGVPELLNDGVTGELFKAGDAGDLKAHLESMLKDDKKLREYTENCKKAIFDTVSEYTEKFLKIVK